MNSHFWGAHFIFRQFTMPCIGRFYLSVMRRKFNEREGESVDFLCMETLFAYLERTLGKYNSEFLFLEAKLISKHHNGNLYLTKKMPSSRKSCCTYYVRFLFWNDCERCQAASEFGKGQMRWWRQPRISCIGGMLHRIRTCCTRNIWRPGWPGSGYSIYGVGVVYLKISNQYSIPNQTSS